MGKWNSLWIRFWMRFAGLSLIGRIATRLATWFAPPYHGRCYLAYLNPKGYISPSATIYHSDSHLGNNVFIGDRVIIFQDKDGGSVKIGRNVCLYGDINIQSGSGVTWKQENVHTFSLAANFQHTSRQFKSDVAFQLLLIVPSILTIMGLHRASLSESSLCNQREESLSVTIPGLVLA